MLLNFVTVKIKTNSTSREDCFLKFDNVYYFGTSLRCTAYISYLGEGYWSIFAL